MSFRYFFYCVPFVCFIFGYFLISFFFVRPEIQTPLLVGKSVHEGVMLLSSHAINMRVIAVKQDSTVLPGTILSQSPAAFQKIKSQQSVFVTVSSVPLQLVVPDMRTKSVQEIKELCQKTYGAYTLYAISSIYPDQYCIAQSPAPGMKVGDSDMIVYIADSSTKYFIWPQFIGKRVLDIVELLSAHSIEYEVVHSDAVDDEHNCDGCRVLQQRPLTGTLIKRNAKIIVQLQVN